MTEDQSPEVMATLLEALAFMPALQSLELRSSEIIVLEELINRSTVPAITTLKISSQKMRSSFVGKMTAVESKYQDVLPTSTEDTVALT